MALKPLKWLKTNPLRNNKKKAVLWAAFFIRQSAKNGLFCNI